MERDAEVQRLAGGFVNEVARIGDTVHRPAPARAVFVHRLLGHLARCGLGWRAAFPRP
jgi:hypothetical protein